MGPNGKVSEDFKKQILGYGLTTAYVSQFPSVEKLPLFLGKVL